MPQQDIASRHKDIPKHSQNVHIAVDKPLWSCWHNNCKKISNDLLKLLNDKGIALALGTLDMEVKRCMQS